MLGKLIVKLFELAVASFILASFILARFVRQHANLVSKFHRPAEALKGVVWRRSRLRLLSLSLNQQAMILEIFQCTFPVVFREYCAL